MTDTVRFSTDGAVGTITIDRPPVNAISAELIEDFNLAIDAAQDPGVRAVIVTGTPHFAAGADIKAFKSELDSGGKPARLAEDLSAMALRLEALRKPVIAAIRGSALGGGLEIALACDFRMLADDARCGQPEIALGIFPGAGGTQRLPRLVGVGPARELIYSGRHLDAEAALAIGLADSVHPADELASAATERAGQYASAPTAAIGLAKDAINRGFGTPLGEGLALESELFQRVFDTDDAAEGLAAFLEKRRGDFNGR
jgi:enoyl-CoA hydratase/carnithine racemase